MKLKIFNRYAASFFGLFFLVACGGASTPTPSSDDSTAFPSSLAITSPTENTSGGTSISSLLLSASINSDDLISFESSYETEVDEIEEILTATTLADCFPNSSELLNSTSNATCYGPTVLYEKHPLDTDGSNDGDLPSGDTGFWTDNNAGTDEACAAAELNARIGGVQDKTSSALKLLASMICTVNNTEGLSLPTDGSSLDLTTAGNAMFAAASMSSMATINSATISAASNSVGTSDYSYAINVTMNIDPDGAGPDPTTETNLVVNMTHRPLDATNATYEGKFNYRTNNEDALGGNCDSSREYPTIHTQEITEIGSVEYELSSATSLKVDARYAQACGHDNAAPLNSSGILDPSIRSETGPDESFAGWTGSFTMLKGELNPANGAGNYSFMWQAGLNDGTARTFNLHLVDVSGTMTGDAFFGYTAEDIEDADGSIAGMYCNWLFGNVGNSNPSNRASLVQHQTIVLDDTSGLYETTDSDITYAPLNDCNFDSGDLASGFKYDQDADGSLADETMVAFTNELVAVTDIADSGFILPEAPSGL